MITFFHKIPRSKLVISREKFIIDMCKNKKVLHIGCVDAGLTDERIETSSLLHHKIAEVGHRVIGIDVDEEGVANLKARGVENIFLVKPEDDSPTDEIFDIIIAGEVLEHVSNAGKFLEKYSGNLDKKGLWLLTVPNAFCFSTFFRLLRGVETVHEDHVSYYSYVTMKNLMTRSNLEILESRYYWTMRGKGISRAIKVPLHIFLKLFPQFGDGVIMVAKKN